MADHSLLIILGNQLFPIEEIKRTKIKKIFMKEDLGLCTNYRHHKLKIFFFLSSMRQYRDYLLENGYEVIYHSIDDQSFDVDFLKNHDFSPPGGVGPGTNLGFSRRLGHP